ncbi:hypothetical protein AVEN_256410-1 [Araneus ventricosus]|uniref:Uncharacterized protein n=1 Tax=Araneus ventricosus TaxID=182803 RepID=A0A4Y2TQG8_ARAVE|nr:hypothetical protein AVEN_256410-1 [Araneus ventricosus]
MFDPEEFSGTRTAYTEDRGWNRASNSVTRSQTSYMIPELTANQYCPEPITSRLSRTYHVQIAHKHKVEDYIARQEILYDLLQACENTTSMQHVMYDEATFHF